jgi:flap endonuclease-1
MGVKGLAKLINDKAQQAITTQRLYKYRGTTQAIDAGIVIYRFGIAIQDSGEDKNINNEIISHLIAILFKTLSLLKYGILPVWVLDGKPPDIKRDTLHTRKMMRIKADEKLKSPGILPDEKRKLEKKTFHIKSPQIEELKKLLDYMGIPCIQSPGEAEAQCAVLNRLKIVDGVATEDGDALLFGCEKMLKNFSNKRLVTEINLKTMLECLDMNQEQLIDLGIILGTDYCEGIGGLSPSAAYEKFKQVECNVGRFIKKLIVENMKIGKYKIPANFIEEWRKAKKYYKETALVLDPTGLKFRWNKPNFEKITQFLVEEKGFEKNKIIEKIDELKLLYYFYSRTGELHTLSKIKKLIENNEQVSEFGGKMHTKDKENYYIIEQKNMNDMDGHQHILNMENLKGLILL